METTRPKSENQNDKKTDRDKKRVSKKDPLGPAFRSARVLKSDSRTTDTRDPSVA
jgi:hypothetical protein